MNKEDTSTGGYTIGHLRMKYLNDADNSYSRGDFLVCKRILENFISTIKEDSESGVELTKELDTLLEIEDKNMAEVERIYKEDAGSLELKDKQLQKERIEVNTIHDIKCACWNNALKYGLFYER